MSDPSLHSRFFIEKVEPVVDGGLFPAKVTVGVPFWIEADIFRDNEDVVQAEVVWRKKGTTQETRAPLALINNDRYHALITLNTVGAQEFKIEAQRVDSTSTAMECSAWFPLWVDRPEAEFSSWYELFVRSQSGDPAKPGTFADAQKRISAIREMGFNVIYLAPIHPIGRTARKGPDAALRAAPTDPGCPWAIGNEQGGHTAIDSSLGTLEDFDRFVAECGKHNMHVAMDFAVQCSPDHSWVNDHPDWFPRRPDGSIKPAGNPPFTYDDIYFLDFNENTLEPIRHELLTILRFWIARGIRFFRVDNPHTKPLRLWQWLIERVHATDPDVVFLAEAFTRPKIMMALSKGGFSQSYTYFTWRHSKEELQTYLTEITTKPIRDYFRPHFFTTTPDVLPSFLQQGGRPAFLIRAALAATLSPLWGIYSGYELCENEAIPQTEEYAHSEKFEIRVRDWNKPGHIKDFIAALNSARHNHKALQSIDGLEFLRVDNPHLIAYRRFSADLKENIVVIITLDPHQPQQGTVELDMPALGFKWGDRFPVKDVLEGDAYVWSDKNFVRLEPSRRVAHLFRIGDMT